MTPHPCPGCNAPVATNARYPLAFCASCLQNAASDGQGTPLEICEDTRMALGYRYSGESVWQPAATIYCRIRGQKAVVNPARFGGLVAEPATAPAPNRAGVVKLA